MAIPAMERYDQSEGTVARTIEQQTSKLPSDTFLWAAVGTMVVSAGLQIAGNKQASLFVQTSAMRNQSELILKLIQSK